MKRIFAALGVCVVAGMALGVYFVMHEKNKENTQVNAPDANRESEPAPVASMMTAADEAEPPKNAADCADIKRAVAINISARHNYANTVIEDVSKRVREGKEAAEDMGDAVQQMEDALNGLRGE